MKHRLFARLLHALLVAILGASLGLTGVGTALGQGTEPQGAPQIELNDAQVEFGAEIRFRLRARGGEPIRSVLLLYQVDDSRVQNTGVPAYQPGPLVTAIYPWRVANVLVPGAEVRYQWQIETASGVKTTTTEQAVTYNDTRFNWRETQGDQLTVYWHTNDAQTGASLLDEARKTQTRLSREFGLTFDKPVRIYAYSRQQDYVSALATGRTLDTAMTFGIDRIFLLAPGGTTAMEPALQGLRREMGHALFVQKTKNPYVDPPQWLAEGFGLFIGGEVISEENYKALGQIAQANKLLPLKTLYSTFPNNDRDRNLAYLESLSVVKFVVDTYGPEKLKAVLTAFKDGSSVDDALKKGLGVTLDQLEGRWKTALKNGSAARVSTAERPGVAGSGDGGVVDRLFGPAIRFWQGVFGGYTQAVMIGIGGFIALGLVAVVGGTIFSLWRRGRAEEDF